eukprot:TRINITY_DN67031_c3_g1_i1.p1 TRINITY_DN67031_c3_g1~~TRINITY_DN67031_c3_g1_i1.p1  ORF type:complete len:539 (-),score=84.06 TRINITY_DN67031_c3_g1_i1:614-2122(-)
MGMHHQHGPPGPPHGPDPNGLPANRGGKVGDVVDDYVIGAEICEGSYGIVRMATLNNPQSSEDKQKKFAIKIVKKERFLETEVSLQQKAEHKNVVSIIKSFPLNDLIYIVLEFCNGGDLFEMVNRKKWLDEPTAAMYFKQMLEAVTVLHAQNICHHDVKLENFFIDKQTVKLGDFGAAEVLSSDGKTQRYKGEVSAPEKLPDATYNGFLADIWQLGKSLHELTFGLRSPKGQGTLNPPHGYTPSPLLVDLLNSMLHSTPTKRPSLEAVLEHKWIKSGGKDARGGWQGEPGSPLTPNNPHHPDRTMFNPPGGGYGWPPHQHMMMQHGQHGFDPFQAQQAAMYGGYQQHQHQQHMFPQQGYGHFQHHQHGMGGHMHGHAHGHGHGGGGYAGKGKGGKKGGNQNKHAGPGGVDRKTPSPVLGNQAENKELCQNHETLAEEVHPPHPRKIEDEAITLATQRQPEVDTPSQQPKPQQGFLRGAFPWILGGVATVGVGIVVWKKFKRE